MRHAASRAVPRSTSSRALAAIRQLIAGVATVSALGTLRYEQFRLVEASQETRGGSQNLGGTTHAVSGIVLVIKLIVRVTVGRAALSLYHNTFRGTRER